MEKQQFDIATELAQLISSEQAYQYRIIPVAKNENQWVFKTDAESIHE
jgi:type IV pilus assembly protein PilB